METPPSYAPPKKSNTGLIIGLILGGIAVCCIGGVALMGFFGLRLFNDTIQPMAECMIGYEAVSDAMKEYAAANGGKLPAAANWQDELKPYVEKELAKVKKEKVPFKIMDPNGEWTCSMGDRKTGMAFNTEVSEKMLDEAKASDSILVFEVDQLGRNVAQKYVARDKSESPKIMGDTRGWITIRASGGVHMGGEGMGGSFDFKSTSGSED